MTNPAPTRPTPIRAIAATSSPVNGSSADGAWPLLPDSVPPAKLPERTLLILLIGRA